MHRNKRSDELVRKMAETREQGFPISVVGWMKSNHSPHTRKLEKLGLVRFHELSTSGHTRNALPNGLVITTRMVKHKTIVGYTGRMAQAVGIGTIRVALEEAFPPEGLEKKVILDALNNRGDEVTRMARALVVAKPAEAEVSQAIAPELTPLEPIPPERASPERSAGDDDRAFLELLHQEFENGNGSITSKKLGMLMRAHGKEPKLYVRQLLRQCHVESREGNQHRYYPGRRLFELFGKATPATESLPTDIDNRLKALLSIISAKDQLVARRNELASELSAVEQKLIEIEKAESQLRKTREALDLSI